MPAMPQTFDICIRGAGVVGRTLALLLARERLRVALVVPVAARQCLARPSAAPFRVTSRSLPAFRPTS